MGRDTNNCGKDTEEERKKRRDVLSRRSGSIFVLAVWLDYLLGLFVPLPHHWFFPIFYGFLTSFILSLLLIEYYLGFATGWSAVLVAALSLAAFGYFILTSFNIVLW